MKKILVVEDEVAIREFEVINLRRVGYETVEAGSGEEALAVYEEHGDNMSQKEKKIMTDFIQ